MYNTGNAIPSAKIEDLSDNAQAFDSFFNSSSLSVTNRFGNQVKSRAGFEADHDAQISAHEVEHDNQMLSFENDFDGRLAGMAFTRVGTFTAGATLIDMRQTLLWEVSQGGDGREYGWTGSFLPAGKVVSAGSSPTPVIAGNWVDRTDVTLRSDLLSGDGDLLVPSIYKSSGCIMASRHGIVSDVDCAAKLQVLQDLSEQYKIPIDFSGIPIIAFSGKITIGTWFHWKGAGRFDNVIKPIDKTRTALGVDSYGVCAWIVPANPDVSITHAMLEDIGFDGGYATGNPVPTSDQYVSAFCWHANGTAKHTDITALRCHFANLSQEAWWGFTTAGGQIDGIRMLFCSSSVTDPTVSANSFNVFKCMNGLIDAPGPYGTYTIRNIVSFGNTATGMRTLNDFKRGCEHFSVSACETYDMNDCHHSTDGSRNGTFYGSNKGYQTGASRATKNFIEAQGIDIDIENVQYDTDYLNTGTKRGVAGIQVTDYEYPSNGGDGVGNNARQSKRVNVFNATIKNVNQHAVRFTNTYKCSASDVHAVNCLFSGVSIEYSAGRVDTTSGIALTSKLNSVGFVDTEGCPYEIAVTANAECILRVPPKNEFGGSRVSYTATSSIITDYAPKLINHSNTLWKSTDFLTAGATKADYTANVPVGVPYAFSLEDLSAVSIQSYDWAGKIPLVSGEYLYMKFKTLEGTSTQASILIQEYDAAGVFISSTFKNITPTGTWSDRQLAHAPTTSNVAYVLFRICPAASSGSSTSSVGTTMFADIRLSKEFI